MVSNYLAVKQATQPMRLRGTHIFEIADMFDGMSFANIEEILKSAINHDIDTGGDGSITTASISRAIIDADLGIED